MIDDYGKIVLAPQSLPLTNKNVENGLYFEYEEFKQNHWREMGFIDRQGKRLFPERFTLTRYTNYKDYFTLALYPTDMSSGTNFDAPYNSLGLGKAGGEIVLPNQFSSIEHIPFTDFFVAEVTHKRDKSPNDTLYQRAKYAYHQGLFNAQTRKWVLDTSASFHIFVPAEPNNPFFIVKNVAKNKLGIMDTEGKIVLPYDYDLVTPIDKDDRSYWVKKKKNYQFLDIKEGKVNIHKLKYDCLFPFTFEMYGRNGTENVHYFFAKRGKKWGVVDAKDNIIAPFEFDYATHPQNNAYDKIVNVILVKNGQANFYSLASLPNSDTNPYNSFITESGTEKPKLHLLSAVGDANRNYLVNDSGKVVIPPQYKLFFYDNDSKFAHVRDEKGRKKIIFLETGKMIDFPYDYQIRDILPNGRVMIVDDTHQNGLGVVSTEGKILVPCNNYNIVIGDKETGTFFVKRDTPTTWWSRFSEEKPYVPETYIDTLSEDDNNWLIYNGNGQQLSATPFRFPIDFKDGLGIGMKDAGFNLYTTEGVVFTPFIKNNEGSKNLVRDEIVKNQGYPNIRRDNKLGYYTFFYTQGLTPAVLLTNRHGEIIVESGRYDGISKFYDKYALTTTNGKVAMIDTFGREVIPPQDLRTSTAHFMDSLDRMNKINQRKSDLDLGFLYVLTHQPLSFVSSRIDPDSLNISNFQRASLWNLMLEKCLSQVILTRSDVEIPRIEHRASVSNYSIVTNEFLNRKEKTAYRISVTDSTIAFCLKDDTRTSKYLEFYNFYHHNNHWEELKINDVLQIQGDKRWQMNELLTQKIKNLKDQQIDCSNASAFITTAETRWMLTQNGIDFCFDSTDYNRSFVVLSFTWAELEPYLKMKIF